MKNTFCPECEQNVKADVVQKKETFNVKGEKMPVTSSVLVCGKCKNEIFDEDLDEKNLLSAYNEYRNRHRLLLPSQIREIREKYGLSQRALSRFLGWGEITINRYESGEIQDSVHNEVLDLIGDPRNMRQLFEKNIEFSSSSEGEKLKKRIDILVQNSSEEKLSMDLNEFLLQSQGIDEYSGYREFNLEKMKQMIIYLTDSLKGVYTTAINKYLWYMDFLYFKENSVSISGCNYVHLPYGPVPNDYEVILGLMVSKKTIEKEEIEFSNGVTGEKFKAKAKPDLKYFTKDEIGIMDFVISQFRKFSAAKLSRYSHNEKAYSVTKDNEKISYNLSKDLSLSLT